MFSVGEALEERPGHDPEQIVLLGWNERRPCSTRICPPSRKDPADDLEPASSSDGTRIAFTKTTDGGDDEIYVVGAGGSNPQNLTENPAIDGLPARSPE